MQRLPTLNFRLFNGDPYLFTPCSRCINPSHQLSHPIAGFQNHAFSTRSYLELGRDIPLLQIWSWRALRNYTFLKVWGTRKVTMSPAAIRTCILLKSDSETIVSCSTLKRKKNPSTSTAYPLSRWKNFWRRWWDNNKNHNNCNSSKLLLPSKGIE